MFVNAGNNFSYKLSASVSENDTNIPGEGSGTPPEYPFYLTINNNRENMEIVKVVDDGDYPFTFKVDRAQEGTTAQAHEAGSLVENNFTAGTYQALDEEIQALKQQSGIAEMGENENGHYIRYENGIQMCWHEVYNDDNTSASGALYQKQIHFIFPKSFVDIPSVYGTERNDVANYVQWTAIRQVHTDGVIAYAICTSQDRPGFYGYQAIGRWK